MFRVSASLGEFAENSGNVAIISGAIFCIVQFRCRLLACTQLGLGVVSIVRVCVARPAVTRPGDATVAAFRAVCTPGNAGFLPRISAEFRDFVPAEGLLVSDL